MATVQEDAPKTLQDEISEALVTCKITFDQSRKFLPVSKFDELVTEERIKSEPAYEEYASDFKESTKVTFTVLMYTELLEFYTDLRKEGLDDECFPLTIEGQTQGNIKLLSPRKKKTFMSLKNCRYRLISGIETEQFYFLAPIFGRKLHMDIDGSCTFPFIETRAVAEGGSFGEVFQVRIHRSHLVGYVNENKPNEEPFMALKRLKPKNYSKGDFQREETALRAILEFEHDHLIQVIASIKRGENYFFLFPWAEGGNLRTMWTARNKHPRSAELILWCLVQIKGISSAMRKLHRPTEEPQAHENWRHGDLRPENIVLFLDRSKDKLGRLCITDVGLARFHEHTTTDRQYSSATPGGFQQYAPPEGLESERSRSYDIWSLGCIYLELLIWMLAGIEEVDAFQKARQSDITIFSEFFYPQTPHSKRDLHPKVRDYIRYLYNDERCKEHTVFYDLLKLIENHLLRIRKEKRHDAAELDQELQRLVDKAKEPSYLLAGYVKAGHFDPSPLPKNQREKKSRGLHRLFGKSSS